MSFSLNGGGRLPVATSLIFMAAAAGVSGPAAAQAVPPPAPGAVAAAPPAGGFMVPRQVALRATTPSEAEAHAIWTLRAALNVGALQCQYSPFLRTVKNYNDFLRHHSGELARAQSVMQGHFRRYDGRRGLNSFDQYTTRTYNSFSTLDAQYSLCAAVGLVGREVLGLRRGSLGAAAPALNLTLRASLEQPAPRAEIDMSGLDGFNVPPIPEVEDDGRKRRRRR